MSTLNGNTDGIAATKEGLVTGWRLTVFAAMCAIGFYVGQEVTPINDEIKHIKEDQAKMVRQIDKVDDQHHAISRDIVRLEASVATLRERLVTVETEIRNGLDDRWRKADAIESHREFKDEINLLKRRIDELRYKLAPSP